MTALKLPGTPVKPSRFRPHFPTGKLTLGLIAPFKGYPDSPVPEMDDFATVIKAADQSGIATLWVRDVPFYDPSFGDVAQIYDPSVTLGYLAALTQNVALWLGGLCFASARADSHCQRSRIGGKISGGRFLLGSASGDRPTEYPPLPPISTTAPNATAKLANHPPPDAGKFPAFNSEHYGRFSGNLDLVPKPAITVCRCSLLAAPAKSWNGLPAKATHGFGTASLPKNWATSSTRSKNWATANLETLWRIEFRRTLEDPERARRVLQQHLPARRRQKHRRVLAETAGRRRGTHYRELKTHTARRAGNHSGFRRKRDTAFCGVRFGVSGCLKC